MDCKTVVIVFNIILFFPYLFYDHFFQGIYYKLPILFHWYLLYHSIVVYSKMPPKKANLSARSREARRKRTKRALMSTKQNTAVNAIERIKIPLNQSSNLAGRY